MRVAVIGGGISGLAAAFDLCRARSRPPSHIETHLFEAGSRLGGVIHTEMVDGCVVEAGPDSFLAEKPEALQLIRELGLADEVIGSNDAERRTYILYRGTLAPLPDGLQFLVPTRLLPMLTTPLAPFAEKLKMVGELFYPPAGGATPDESVADFVTRHFGPGMAENIAAPLLAGVYGGDAAQLSARSTLPRFVQMEQQQGSLVRAVLRARKKARRASSASPPPPIFSALKGGLRQLVEALQSRLDGCAVHCGTPVETVRGGNPECNAPGGNGYTLQGAGGRGLGEFEAVVLALPAHQSARVLEPLDPELAAPLATIPYSSSMTVALGYPGRVRQQLPPGFGFLAPRRENRRLLACTFVHAKFSGRATPERALLRCFLGGSRDEPVLELDDASVLALVRSELAAILGLSDEPLFTRVYRWPRAMAQYTVGHQERVAAVKQRVARHPGLFLAGNWDSGIGISDCIRSGRAAAAAIQQTFDGVRP